MTPSLIRLFTAFKVLAARAPNWCVKGACRPPRYAESSISPLSVARQGAYCVSGAGLVARLAAAAIPSGGGGSCRCVMPLLRSPGSLSRRLLPALPAPPCRSARWLSGRLSGLSCRSRCSTLGLSCVGGWACRPRLWLAVCRGLRGACRPRLWLAVCRGLRGACRFSVGRTTLNNEFSIIGYSLLRSLAPSVVHTPITSPRFGGY